MKPKKPYPTFPLTPHVRGGWQKRYKGKLIYIPPADPDEALSEFHRRARAIDAGKVRRKTKTDWTVGALVNAFYRDKRLDHENGNLSADMLKRYRSVTMEAVTSLGRDTIIHDLHPDDFSTLYRHWQKRMKSHALALHVQIVRTMFKHGTDSQWIPLVAFGRTFRKPTLGRKQGFPLSTDEVLLLLDKSHGIMRAFILACANCAYTAVDCRSLPVAALAGSVLRFPRPKMQNRKPIDRACVLWPETLAALSSIRQPGSALFFHGERGTDFRSDVWGHHFSDLCAAVKIPRRGPGWIRHWFRTIADECGDPHATCRIMGHRLPGMAETYIDAIEHVRLQRITDHVRKALIHLECPAGEGYEI
jgi:hypothetical protein